MEAVATLGDAEGILGDHDVGSKGAAGPLLAIGAMAESGKIRFAC